MIWRVLAIGALALACGIQAWGAGTADPASMPSTSAWKTITKPDYSDFPADIKGFVAPQPGEHPRLFFRKADLEKIRQRAQTPEGKAMVARLKFLLGGGEDMPTTYNDAKDAYTPRPRGWSMPIGTYTLWHGAGFGMLYQLTGDKKYADLGRQCVEKAFDGQRDIDDRLSWMNPPEFMRAGPSISAIAEAYDLCYEGWDEDFRKKVAQEIQNYAKQATKSGKRDGLISLERMALHPFMPSTSNHFANEVGGAAIAVLAIKGDPGTDDDKLNKWMDGLVQSIALELHSGFGDGGYFYEHEGPGEVATGEAFTLALQAMRVAGGKDFINGVHSNGRAVSSKWIWELLPTADHGPMYPNHTAKSGQGSGYGNEDFDREGGHHGGHFSQGFGAIPDDQKPAMLWVYKHIVEPGEGKEYPKENIEKTGDGKSYDALFYPHRAALALINWPIGVDEKNPAEVLPRVLVDQQHRHFVFRNRWKDGDDCIVSVLLGARTMDSAAHVRTWGDGDRIDIGRVGYAPVTSYKLAEDGSGIINIDSGSYGDNHVIVDYSGASGADAMVAMVGSAATGGKAGPHSKITELKLGDTPVLILTFMSKGDHPAPTVEDGKIKIGKQVMTYDGKVVDLAIFGPPPTLKQ